MADDEQVDLLFEKWRGGTESAFDELYRILRPQIQCLPIRWLGNAVDANDVVQICFIKLVKKRLDWNASRGHFRPWFFTVVQNAIHDFHQSKKSFEPLPEDDSDEIAIDPMIDVSKMDWTVTKDTIESVLKPYPLIDRQMFDQRYFGEASLDHLAAKFQLSQAAVKQRLWRMKNQVAKSLRRRRLGN